MSGKYKFYLTLTVLLILSNCLLYFHLFNQLTFQNIAISILIGASTGFVLFYFLTKKQRKKLTVEKTTQSIKKEM